ncbi:P-loop containing nucleoside triphosphate hydrolase protein [Coemansia spiralis]|nr:P-loop containing nucleoside triphosphate hydrolase protein [Coemansia spiralis]
MYPAALAQSGALCFVFAAVCLVAYARSNRLFYVGLFPWILPALIVAQLVSGLAEVYFSFFTVENSNVPIFGRNASVRSNLLVLTAAINFILTILFSSVQRRIIFARPLDSAGNSSLGSSYTLLTSEDEDADGDETTPLGHSYEQKENELVDTPEFSSSWLGRLTFSWINSLLRIGVSRQLTYSDIYRLDKADMPVSVWRRYLRYRKPGRSLAVTVVLTLAPDLLLQAAFSLTVRTLHFSGPFFLQRIIRSIELSSKESLEFNNRRMYLDAFCLLFFTLSIALLTNQILWIGTRAAIRLKGLLVAELSSKTLRRHGKGSLEKKRENSESGGDDEQIQNAASAAADGKVMNLLTADFQTIAEATAYVYNVYSMPLTLCIGIWYMYQILGISAFVGWSFICICVPISKILYTHLASLTVRINSLSDERISMISELLQGIKAVKLFGWESRFVQKIDEQREHQLEYTWKYFLCKVAIDICARLNPMMIILSIFATYVVVFGNKLTAEVAFTSISIFQLVYGVFDIMPRILNSTVQGYVALDRIDSYLDQPQVQDLEKRVALEFDNVLGFKCADLEWETTEDIEALLAEPAQSHAVLSTNVSSTSLSHQNNMTVFSLKNIDVLFPIGGLSIVAGPTGSGKSSLLLALIGEMNLTRGYVLLPTADASVVAAGNSNYRDIIELADRGLAIRDIAYVAQEAWLRNATIRENILFGETYNKSRYEEVLRACALKPDLRILKAGDATEIGERGVTLSGGQKQRVALARAVYSSRRILLIDDCLSAVDAHTGKHILMECLLNKTSLMKGRTCVLVTHHVSMCLPFAQFLLMMHEGQISRDDTSKDVRETEDKLAKAANDMKPEDEYNHERLQNNVVQGGVDSNDGLPRSQGALFEEEKHEKGFIKLEVWQTYFYACGSKSFWTMTLALLILWQAVIISQDYWIRIWVNSNGSKTDGSVAYMSSLSNVRASDTATRNETHKQYHSSFFWLGVYVLIGFVHVFGRAIHDTFVYRAAVRASRTLHARLLRAVVHASPRFFDSTPLGRIINRFSRDMQTIDGPTIDKLMLWLGHVSGALGIYVVVLLVTPMFIFVAIAVSLVYIGFAYYYLSSSRELKRLESNSMSPLLSLFSELILGVSTIRAFGVKQLYIKEALNRISAHNRPFYMVLSSKQWLAVHVGLAGAVVTFSCAMFIIMNRSWMDAGLAGFTLAYSLAITEHMFWVVGDYNTCEANMNSVERVKQYLNIEQEAALESEPENKPPALWPTKGAVQIENLTAEYMPGVPVLHGVSLAVKHGEKIGVVGRTGAGKSTLSLALLRFVEASSGRIVLDGIDISKIGLEALRRSVTIIPQDPVLFNGTIRFNLDPFNEYPDEIVWDALRRTHLVRESSGQSSSSASSINNVERMSGIFSSLDAEIKENGQNLSLGQRQLVALARALVRRSRLIVMDEATASVDFDTDDRIQRTIRGYELANSTLFCIAHRLRTIIDYDRVLVLDKGKVAEFDTPQNLMQNKDGIFRGMCEKSGEYRHLAASANRKANKSSAVI